MSNLHCRAWDRKVKKMYGVLVINFYPTGIMHSLDLIGDGLSVIPGVLASRLDVLQATSHMDKNGKDIFVGDFVESWYDDITRGNLTQKTRGVVVSVPGGFVIYESAQVAYPMIGLVRETQVIGNIYENPELVEAK